MISQNNLIHLCALIALLSYLQYCLSQFFNSSSFNPHRFGKSFFKLGLLANFIFLFLVLQTEIGQSETSYVFESHPALVLLLVSFVFFFALNFVTLSSVLLVRFFSLGALLFFLIGAILLHREGLSRVYELSPLLIMHILISLISQVFLLLTFILSILIVVLDRGLKEKGLISDFSAYPPLVPTQNIWAKALGLGCVSFSIAILTGIVQTGGLVFSFKILTAFLSLLGLLLAFFLYRMTKVSLARVTLWLSIYIAIVFTFQVLVRYKIIFN